MSYGIQTFDKRGKLAYKLADDNVSLLYYMRAERDTDYSVFVGNSVGRTAAAFSMATKTLYGRLSHEVSLAADGTLTVTHRSDNVWDDSSDSFVFVLGY